MHRRSRAEPEHAPVPLAKPLHITDTMHTHTHALAQRLLGYVLGETNRNVIFTKFLYEGLDMHTNRQPAVGLEPGKKPNVVSR